MNPKINFTLSTEFTRFENWLNDFRIRVTSFTVPLPDGKSFGIIGENTFRLMRDGFRQHTINGMFLTPDKDDPTIEHGSYPIRVIGLTVFESAPVRTNITIECGLDLVLPLYDEMLVRISEIWTESKQVIDNHLTEIRIHPDYMGPKKGERLVLSMGDMAAKAHFQNRPDLSARVIDEAARRISRVFTNNEPEKYPPMGKLIEKHKELPNWWPHQRAKQQRWAVLYRKILPLVEKGMNHKQIAKELGIRRQSIPHIIEWHNRDPNAHGK